MAISEHLKHRLKVLEKKTTDAKKISEVTAQSSALTAAGGFDSSEVVRKLKQARKNINGFIAKSDGLYDNVNDVLFPLIGVNVGSIKELPVSSAPDSGVMYRIPEQTCIVEIPVGEGNFKLNCTQANGIRYGVSVIATGVVNDDIVVSVYVADTLKLTVTLTESKPQQLITIDRDSSATKILTDFGIDTTPIDTPAVKQVDEIDDVSIEVIDGTTITSVKTINFTGSYLPKKKKMKTGVISTSTPSIQTDVTDGVSADDRFLFVNNRTINVTGNRLMVPRKTGSEMVASNTLAESQTFSLPTLNSSASRKLACNFHCYKTNYLLTTDSSQTLLLCKLNETMTNYSLTMLTMDEYLSSAKPIMVDPDNGIFILFTNSSGNVANAYIIKINKTTSAMSILNKMTLNSTASMYPHKIAGHYFICANKTDGTTAFYRYDINSKTFKSVTSSGFDVSLQPSIFVRDVNDVSSEIYIPSTGKIRLISFINNALTSTVADTTAINASAVLRTTLGEYIFVVAGTTYIRVFNRTGTLIKSTAISYATIADTTQIEGNNYLLLLTGSAAKTTSLVRVDNDGTIYTHTTGGTGDVLMAFGESAGRHYFHRVGSLWSYCYEINFAERALGWQEIIKR